MYSPKLWTANVPYRVDNFGSGEGKSVEVTCKIWDKNANLITSVTKNEGNIASASTTLGESVTKNIPFSRYEDGSISCYIERCENCKILMDDIPELKELYRD
ncbi:unnamed protein product [marine sediment metagenome]|uniref:Uncharacterized protein n=1 Tax=marine sediment metagenome TaxID=412755 RepID=X1B7N3_9ZZZZ